MSTGPLSVQPSDEKLQEMILYIAQKCAHRDNFGVTALAKMLWFVDTESFVLYGKPVTQGEYIRLDHGPVPKLLKDTQKEMTKSGKLGIAHTMFRGKAQKTPVALANPNLKIFSPEEIDIANRVIERYCGHTATKLSALTHGRVWRNTPRMDPIPLGTVFISDEPITELDLWKTEQRARKYDWPRSQDVAGVRSLRRA